MQAQIRGYLARKRFKKLIGQIRQKERSKITSERYMKSIRTIQSFWRGFAVRKVYKELKLDKATKAMQFGYFCEQV